MHAMYIISPIFWPSILLETDALMDVQGIYFSTDIHSRFLWCLLPYNQVLFYTTSYTQWVQVILDALQDELTRQVMDASYNWEVYIRFFKNSCNHLKSCLLMFRRESPQVLCTIQISYQGCLWECYLLTHWKSMMF